jgi:hypothetical protein
MLRFVSVASTDEIQRSTPGAYTPFRATSRRQWPIRNPLCCRVLRAHHGERSGGAPGDLDR